MKNLIAIYSGVVIGLCSSVAVASENTTNHLDASQIKTYQDEMRKVAIQFSQQLSGTLKKEMQEKGAEASISVCNQVAPKIANELSTKTGWKVTRVGTKVRNSMLGTPDAWEQQVMSDFNHRANKGEDLSKSELIQVVTEPQGKYVRYVKPIQMQPVCLTCHGDVKTNIPQPVAKKLNELYPNDHATGYQAGQLRGLISIKRQIQ